MCASEQPALPQEKPVSPRKGAALLIPAVLMGMMWLGINSTTLDKSLVATYKDLLIVGAIGYLFLIVVVKSQSAVKDMERVKLFPHFFLGYTACAVIVFMVFVFGLLYFQGGLNAVTALPEVWAAFLLSTCLVIAPVETLTFQFIFPKLLSASLANKAHPKMQNAGGILSQVLFGVFHFNAYGGNALSIIVAIVLGIVFYTLVVQFPSWGLGGAMGAHASYNIAIVAFGLTGAGSIFGGGMMVG